VSHGPWAVGLAQGSTRAESPDPAWAGTSHNARNRRASSGPGARPRPVRAAPNPGGSPRYKVIVNLRAPMASVGLPGLRDDPPKVATTRVNLPSGLTVDGT